MTSTHQYRGLPKDKMEELLSNFLIESWSYSKVSSFARNEKAFEMIYIYRKETRRGASEVAGTGYHSALSCYFLEKKNGRELDVVEMDKVAFKDVDEVQAHRWKIQKTTPTIEDCRQKANDTSVSLIRNFLAERSVYERELKNIIEIELYCNEFLTINGVDIPLQCHGVIDLAIETIDGKIVIIDHKSKASFTDIVELKLLIGKQAITYVKLFEEKTGITVDEVWFIENKISKNRDGSPQLNCFKIAMDYDTRRLYEALLYEPLKRMLEAVSDPNHVYVINDSDNFIDTAELHEFWMETLIAEVEDFNIPEKKKDLVAKRLKKIRDASLYPIDPKVIKEFRKNAAEFIPYDLSNKDMTKEEKIEHTLKILGLSARVAHKFDGYSSDTFLVEISSGTNLASIFKYKLDIANALSVPSVRIPKDLFIHHGKSFIAVEASKTRERDLNYDRQYLIERKIPIGLDNFNVPAYWDLNNPSTPHALICGSTGSGKSVCIRSIIEYVKELGDTKIIIFDPKYEFLSYRQGAVDVYNEIERIEDIMEGLVKQMNDLVKAGKTTNTMLVFDEFADAVSNARSGAKLDVYQMVKIGEKKDGTDKMERRKVDTKKSLEENLRILLQKGRSVGYRIVAATQRASTKVITGDAKVNFPVQICFKVPKEVDSKVILDEAGAESLAGKGDGLLRTPEYPGIIRFQAFFKN